MEATVTTRKSNFCSSKQKYRIRCLNIFSCEENWCLWLGVLYGSFILVTTRLFGKRGKISKQQWKKQASWTIICFDSGTTISEQKSWNQKRFRDQLDMICERNKTWVPTQWKSLSSDSWIPLRKQRCVIILSDFRQGRKSVLLRLHTSGAFLGGVSVSRF